MSACDPIAVTGIGAVSALGTDVPAHLDALKSGRHGIAPAAYLDTIHRGKLPVGEVPFSNEALYELLALPPDAAWTRSTLLAGMAVREALHTIGTDDNTRTGFISAATVGGMDVTEKFYDAYFHTTDKRHFIPAHPCGYGSRQLAAYFGISGFVTTVSTACSSAANAIMLGARMIRAGMLDRVIAGGTDCLSRFTINGFNALMIYSPTHCRPFDAARNGLNLGEAAAYLVLEADHVLKQEGRKPLAFLSGYGNANDAYHQTASSDEGDGALLAMQTALATAGLPATDIDYINAHGTATPNNDQSEGTALLRLYGDVANVPPFSSTKAFTGHTLAAAGAVEAVFSILAIQQQLIFPNLNFRDPIPDLHLVPETSLRSGRIQHVLSNSLGFGGNCTSLIFSTPDD